jgi:hypothetical protein
LSYPALAAAALLDGMLAATYLRSRADRDVTARYAGGGLLSLLATNCPPSNKLLGTSGTFSKWTPLQPLLTIASIVLLAWALEARLAAEQSHPVPTPNAAMPLTQAGRDD